MNTQARDENAADKLNEALRDRLSKLPGALFEDLVSRIDTRGAVPGREAPQLTRAIELMRVAQAFGRFEKLKVSVEQIDDGFKHSAVPELIGILMSPELDGIRDEIVYFAFVQVRRTVSSVVFRNGNEQVVSALVVNLHTGMVPAQGQCDDLMKFAVLCHDLAFGVGIPKIAQRLADWLNRYCTGTGFTIETIRSSLPQQEAGRIHRLAIEIAWHPPTGNPNTNQSAAPEAYYRCGTLREPIQQCTLNADRHQTVADLLEAHCRNEKSPEYPVDHVEVLLPPELMHEIWECRIRNSANEEYPSWHPFPVCLRLFRPVDGRRNRPCPKKVIQADDIATTSDADFLERVQDKGVFIGASLDDLGETPPDDRIRRALNHASIAIWTRKTFEFHDKLRTVLKDFRVEDVPQRIHQRRTLSDVHEIWRHVVVLFDPNLPCFKFCHEQHGPTSQQITNFKLEYSTSQA